MPHYKEANASQMSSFALLSLSGNHVCLSSLLAINRCTSRSRVCFVEQINMDGASQRSSQTQRPRLYSGTACDQCFRTKVRCSSERPACAQCVRNNGFCTYSTSKAMKGRGANKRVAEMRAPEQSSDESNTRTEESSEKSLPERPDRAAPSSGKSRQPQVCTVRAVFLSNLCLLCNVSRAVVGAQKLVPLQPTSKLAMLILLQTHKVLVSRTVIRPMVSRTKLR